ncbi:MAG: hypothetical protein OEV94_02560 [Deltaproteobacteria bacterium]|nr:hypothetical protein [Deltaproteobacteria bacterium]
MIGSSKPQASPSAVVSLSLLWEQGQPEPALCAVPGCTHQAVEIDLYFPYLDDRNRCHQHLRQGK